MNYTREQLQKIGNNVAMLWGAVCERFVVSKTRKVVTFYCNEFGERFKTEIPFDELEEYL